jgi:hypothetical protein
MRAAISILLFILLFTVFSPAFAQGNKTVRLGDSGLTVKTPAGIELFSEDQGMTWDVAVPGRSVEAKLSINGDPMMLIGMAMLAGNMELFSAQMGQAAPEIEKTSFSSVQGNRVVKLSMYNQQIGQAFLFYTLWLAEGYLTLAVAGENEAVRQYDAQFDSLCAEIRGDQSFSSPFPIFTTDSGLSLSLPPSFHALDFPEEQEMIIVLDEEFNHFIFIGGVRAEDEEDFLILNEMRDGIRSGDPGVQRESFQKLIDQMEFNEKTGIAVNAEDIAVIPGIDPIIHIPVENSSILAGASGSIFISLKEEALMFAMTLGDPDSGAWGTVQDILDRTTME